MDFSAALKKMQEGKRIVRPMWNEPNQPIQLWLEIRAGQRETLNPLASVAIKTREQTYVQWQGAGGNIVPDILATDWEEVAEAAPPGEVIEPAPEADVPPAKADWSVPPGALSKADQQTVKDEADAEARSRKAANPRPPQFGKP